MFGAKLTARGPVWGEDEFGNPVSVFDFQSGAGLPAALPGGLTTGGAVEVSAAAAAGAAKPVATIQTLADYLVSGFWTTFKHTPTHHWASHTIFVNINALNSAEQVYAQSALNAWRDVANVTFVYVTSGPANITYDHTGGTVAITDIQPANNTNITSAAVHIGSSYGGGASSSLSGLSYQAYVHETGHALGLGHQGPYDSAGSGPFGSTYANSAIFANDTVQWSVMSYWDQSNYSGGTSAFAITPEMADIYAIQAIYGAATTRTDNTTYGFHSTAGATYDFSKYSTAPAFTIYDSGGSDTLDCSGYGGSQTIDLTPGNWSSIGGITNNIGIYTTTNIEKAIGGSGIDTITGNALDNTLRGGLDNDTIDGGAGTDSAVFSGLRSAYTLTALTGNGVRVSGPDGVDTLSNVEKLVFDDQTVNWPQPQPSLQPDLTITSFRLGAVSGPVNSSTTLSYSVTNSGSTASQATNVNVYLSSDNVFGPGDAMQAILALGAVAGGQTLDGSFKFTFNTSGSWFVFVVVDPIDNVVEANESNNVSSPIGINISSSVPDLDASNLSLSATSLTSGGSTTLTYTVDNGRGNIAAPASIVGIYRSALDGESSDVLLATRSIKSLAIGAAVTDTFTLALTTPGKYHLYAVADYANTIPERSEENNGSNWVDVTVAGKLNVSDFGADHRSDILWHNDNGATSIWDNGQIDRAHIIAQVGAVPASWHISGGADFDGNGLSDILWRNDNGAVSIWDNGQIANAHIIANAGVVPNSWHVSTRGDFDGNGHGDILWRNDNGAASIWNNGAIGGAHIIADAGVVSNSWHIAAAGDFDADGLSDILWRNDNSAVSIWDTGAIGNAHIIANAGIVSNSWHIAGIGDFDANGHDDILWRNDNGAASIWDNGRIENAHIIANAGVVPNSWHIADTGDYDGNGHSDILWQNDNGAVSIWDNGAIGNAHIIANAGLVPNGWHIV